MTESRKCPRCGKSILLTKPIATWCSSYGEEMPWITEDEVKQGITYETKYPNGCGFMFMAG